MAKNFTLPSRVSDRLYPHQMEGVSWLVSHHDSNKGCILADGMGLGKTRLICAFMAGLFQSNMVKRVLVVIRPMSFKLWKAELESVSLSGMFKTYCSCEEKKELGFALQARCILITTYNVLRSNYASFGGDNHDTAWDYMFLDDGHEVRNRDTQNSQNLAKVPRGRCVIITGAPFHTNLKDLFVLFDFCRPHLLGTGEKGFVEKYEKVIIKGNYKKATEEEKSASLAAVKEMRRCYEPFLLRRMKNGIHSFPIPKKYEVVVWLKLNEVQRQAYEAIRSHKNHETCCFPVIMSLRNICDSTILLKDSAIDEAIRELDTKVIDDRAYEEFRDRIRELESVRNSKANGSCKIPFISNLVFHLRSKQNKILIYSRSREMLKQIKASLSEESELIDGDISLGKRHRMAERFEKSIGAKILLLSNSAGGWGLKLTTANRVILVEPDWSPSIDNQNIDSIYRIGQKENVVVYRLITCGTVEEKMYRKQVFKDGLGKETYELKELTCYFDEKDFDGFLGPVKKREFRTSSTHSNLKECELELQKGSTLREHLDDLEKWDHVVGVNLPEFYYCKGTLIDRDLKEEIESATNFIKSIKKTYKECGRNTPDKGKKLLERLKVLRKRLKKMKRQAAAP